ncbi:MAG TPA: hypothetical protein VFN76_06720 [Candidatus Limnocylindria bacterium]|nr:hypothetical protein [Candidatus Limnocylindria bacterium]
MSGARPPISICVGTTAGWPAIEPCVRSFIDDARRVGGEILIADGSGRPPPDDPDVASAVTWMTCEEQSVFWLVDANVRRARGDVVALTEDHCTARPGWVDAILRAHAEYPDAAAIGGAIENEETGTSALRWASHLMTQGAHMAPLANGPSRHIANEANISYKRWALADIEPHPLGFMTIRHTRSLADRGEQLVNDDRIVIDHHESLGATATAVIHFDDGRTVAGFRRRQMGTGDWVRLAGAPILPLYRSARVVRNAAAKGYGGTALKALPWLLVLEYAHGVGELIGYVAGAGRSPYGLR